MIDFKHQYFLPEEGKTLCMKCGDVIFGPDIPRNISQGNYHEINIKWDANGIETKGILIVCSKCKDYTLEKKHENDIYDQVVNAFEKVFKIEKKEDKFNSFKEEFKKHKIKGGK